MAKSKAQEFAQLRNAKGGLLKGIIKNLDTNIRQAVTGMEEEQLDSALEYLERMYEDWGDNYQDAKGEHV